MCAGVWRGRQQETRRGREGGRNALGSIYARAPARVTHTRHHPHRHSTYNHTHHSPGQMAVLASYASGGNNKNPQRKPEPCVPPEDPSPHRGASAGIKQRCFHASITERGGKVAAACIQPSVRPCESSNTSQSASYKLKRQPARRRPSQAGSPVWRTRRSSWRRLLLHQ